LFLLFFTPPLIEFKFGLGLGLKLGLLSGLELGLGLGFRSLSLSKDELDRLGLGLGLGLALGLCFSGGSAPLRLLPLARDGFGLSFLRSSIILGLLLGPFLLLLLAREGLKRPFGSGGNCNKLNRGPNIPIRCITSKTSLGATRILPE
jgi:hypothetical protein